MPEKKLLFSEKDLSAILHAMPDKVRSTVEALPESAFAADREQTITDLVERFALVRVQLQPDRVEVATQSRAVDVSHEWFERGAERGERLQVPGTRVSYHVPYIGDPGLFDCRGNAYTLNPPRARVTEHDLIFEYDVPAGQSAAQTKLQFDRDLADVVQWLGWVNEPVDEFMRSLPGIVQSAFNARAQRLTRATDEIAALGLPIRKPVEVRKEPAARPDVPTTTRQSPPQIQNYDVAFSFAGEDRAYVLRVADALKVNDDLSFFYDEFEKVNLWGRDLGPHLAEIYGKKSRFVVIFISRHYAEKVWTRWEWKNALAGAIATKSDRVLPARFDDTELSGLLPTLGYIDLRTTPAETLATMIADKLRLTRAERGAATPSTGTVAPPTELGEMWVDLDYPKRVGMDCDELVWKREAEVAALVEGEGYEPVIARNEVGKPCRVRCHAGPDMTLLRRPKT